MAIESIKYASPETESKLETKVFPRPGQHASGIVDWLTTIDHKKIGLMYGLAALFFLLVGGVEALIIRTQLDIPENDLISAQRYNQLFTMHGTTMIFLAIMPLNAAFFNFLVPLQIGARDVAFPRINSFSLWAFVAGAIVINFGWVLQALQVMGLFEASGPTAGMTDLAPAMGWFGYAPLTGTNFTGAGTDFWIMGLQILGIASLSAAMNFVVTIVNMRAPGMKMMRMPVFTWMTLVVSLLIVFAFPAITIA
ncbi:MAG: cbb3-type cytochrome c oxidase subunit I, partial [Verrucomicrobiota bacterium]|nr:cbb3-type cytochrome c oxidase subunit I [Verrucomicrobiota bacterium]